jgi:uracil phosphoribosyltransferase
MAPINKFIDVKLITAGVDHGMNDQKYIVPGLGDYGDRYYDTVE